MEYYDSDKMLKLIRAAFEGNEEAIAAIKSIAVPFAFSEDYSTMIIVKEKNAIAYDSGMVKKFNMRPERGKSAFAAEIYDAKNRAVWSNIPIPYVFDVREVICCDQIFSFISSDGQQIGGTIAQIKKAMFDVVFAVDGASPQRIEACFFSIPSTVVSPPKPEKTIHENPSILDDMVGIISFDENLQQFEAKCNIRGKELPLYIQVDSRNEVLKMLPIIHSVLSEFDGIDNTARNYTADELIGIKNDKWLEPDERIVDKESFIQRLSVSDILFSHGGNLTIWYNDDNMFLGHYIAVCCDGKNHPKSIELCG